MDVNDIPKNKMMAERSLLMVKLELLSLAKEIANGHSTVCSIEKSIWDRIKMITEILEEI